MAEGLPRYRKAGVLLADLPRLDFGDRRESARSSALLDERLGQLSQWALGEAADRAKDEGLQFGAENPVTMQQLRAAEDVGRSPNELLQPRHTVFGEAARSMQVAALASDVEIDGQETINRLKIASERGEIDAPTVAKELRALVDGTGKSLAKIDPKASHKVRAALATSANSAYLSILQSSDKKQGEQRRVVIDDWISNAVPQQVRAHLEAGDTVDPSGVVSKRPDGTDKGTGFLGPLRTPDGSIATEYSIGVEINGKEIDIPTLIPTLTREEVQQVLRAAGDPTGKTEIPDAIEQKAADFARQRLAAGKSVFAEPGEGPAARAGVITPNQRIIATLHGPLRELLKGQSDEFARQADKRFADIVARERVNVLSAHALENNLSLAQIRGGQLGKYTGTWREMQADDQEKVVVNFMQESGRRHLFEDRTRKQGEESQKREVYDLLSGYWTMRDGPKKDTLKSQIVAKGQGVLSFDQLKSLLKPAGDGEGKENVDLEIRAIDLVRRGGVTDLAEVQRRVPNLAPKQLKRLQDSIYDAGDRQLRDGVRNLAGIPDGLVNMSGDDKRRYAALTAEMERLKAEEIAANTKAGHAGALYNPATVMGKLRDAKDRVTANKAVDDARAALESYGKGKKGAVITETTSEQELKALKFSPAEINEIRRRQRVIRGD